MRCKLHEYAICFRGERYLSVRAASIATLSTWTYLMNKMSRRARAISWRAINCKAYVAKWEETKLRIRLMKNETRSHTHILTYIVHCLFFLFFFPQNSSGRCCCHSRSPLMSTTLTFQSGGRTLAAWCGQLCHRYRENASLSSLSFGHQRLSHSLLFYICMKYGWGRHNGQCV